PPPSPRLAPKRPISMSISRKPIPTMSLTSENYPVIQNSPGSPVRIAGGVDPPEASTAQVEDDYDIPPVPKFSKLAVDDQTQLPANSANTEYPPRRDSQFALA